MKTLRLSLLLCGLMTTAASAQHPNVAPGFQADKVYQFNGVDSVNIYNGNLTLTVPIGQQYGGNGTLRYGLVLTYNSKAWQYDIPTFSTGCNGGLFDDPNCQLPYVKAIPSRRSNAGMGWMVSLGRLIGPGDPIVYTGNNVPGPNGWVYESPDGASHVFSASDPTSPTTTQYTPDGSFLRLRHIGGGRHAVDFPDGTVHTFADYGTHSPRLEEIADPFVNRLAVTYASNGDWTLTEYGAGSGSPIRTHYVRFQDFTDDPVSPLNAPPNYDFGIREIDLAAFNGQRAVYSFEYTTDEIPYGCFGDLRSVETPNPTLPRLRRVKLPDETSWDFDYDTASGCSSIKSMTLPTKGKVEWTYGGREMPTTKCRQDLVPDQPFEGTPPFESSEGVSTRTITVGGAEPATTTYSQVLELFSGYSQVCVNHNQVPLTGRKHQQSKVTVLAPDGGRSEHFFSVFPYPRTPGVSDFSNSEYGLNFTRSASASGDTQPCSFNDPGALCLSTRTYGAGELLPARSTFVRYEGEHREFADEQYRREAESRTVFKDDGDRYVQTKRSSYDGLGHYRATTTWSSCANESCAAGDSWAQVKTATTNFNPGKPDVTIDPVTWVNLPGSNRPGLGQKWLLSSFDRTTTTVGTETISSEYAFSATTGFLNRRRALRRLDGVRDGRDLVAEFIPDGRGNVLTEAYFGGDLQSVGTGDLMSAVSGLTPEYKISHTYDYGSRKSSAYVNGQVPVLSLLDATIDANTGLVERTKDPSEVAIRYQYDRSGRLTDIIPVLGASSGMATLKYTYPPATAPPGTPITEQALSSAGAVLKASSYGYDGLGRVTTTKTKMPPVAGEETWSTVETRYDKLGRKKEVSEPYLTSPSHWTTFEYDSLGRTKKVTAPDASVTTLAYVGAREQHRTSSVQTAAGPTPVTVKEFYDGLGRLVSIEEKSGPANGLVATRYGYDAGDRLTSVRMLGSESAASVQDRTFVYDGLGFLREEKHPEMSRVYYHGYDARGHATLKVFSSPLAQPRTVTKHDLRFTFDRAERLTLVEGQHPTVTSESFLPLKLFMYGQENVAPGDLMKGKLRTAERWNYSPVPTEVTEDIFKVVETYLYQDPAGRKTGRVTEIYHGDLAGYDVVRSVTQSVSYDELGAPSNIVYPACYHCTFSATKELHPAYSVGRLSGITRVPDNTPTQQTVAANFSYAPSGAMKSFQHANAMVDSTDVDEMSRPKRIQFQSWKVCAPPGSVTLTATNTTIGPGLSVTITASVTSGSTPFVYQWLVRVPNGTWEEFGGPSTSPAITVYPPKTTSYLVRVRNACAVAESGTVGGSFVIVSAPLTISITNECEAPQLATQPVSVQVAAGTPATLSVVATGTAPLTYAWYATASPSTTLGTASSFTVTPTQTTTYACRVSNSCGQVTSTTAQIVVALPKPANLLATRSGANSIALSWSASAGAHHYTLERMSTGGAFTALANPTATSYSDAGLASGQTFVYRVRAVDSTGGSSSEPSNRDLATTMTFSSVAAGMFVDDAVFHELLVAVNALRGALGSPPLSWSTILPVGVPAPGNGVPVSAAHLEALRARMDSARLLLEVTGGAAYLDVPIVVGQTTIKAAHVTALQQRAQ